MQTINERPHAANGKRKHNTLEFGTLNTKNNRYNFNLKYFLALGIYSTNIISLTLKTTYFYQCTTCNHLNSTKTEFTKSIKY